MKIENNQSAAIGLDVGTSRIVVARQNGAEPHFARQLNAFVNLPFSKITQSVLEKERVPYTAAESELVVYGDQSERFAALQNAEVRRPMLRGVLNPGEADAQRLMAVMLRNLVGEASPRGQKLCFTVPAPTLGSHEDLSYHETALRQMLGGLGFEVSAIPEGLAVVYSELEATNYTGIGISCGGGLCNFCLAYLSVPVLTFSIPKAGDYIDTSAASVIGERANRVRILKEESFYLNGTPSEKIDQALAGFYDDMIQTLVSAMSEAFAKGGTLPKIGRAVPLVLSGGSALPRGFRDRFEQVLRTAHFPVELSEIRLAAKPLTSAAKGALVAALSEM